MDDKMDDKIRRQAFELHRCVCSCDKCGPPIATHDCNRPGCCYNNIVGDRVKDSAARTRAALAQNETERQFRDQLAELEGNFARARTTYLGAKNLLLKRAAAADIQLPTGEM